MEKQLLRELTTLHQKAKEKKDAFIIINTDGWIQGEAAEKFKITMIEKISPNIVIAIQKGDELTPILKGLEKKGFRTINISSSSVIKKRTKK